MGRKITINNVKNFIEGNIESYKNKIGLTPRYIVEQYHYRLEVCKDDCLVEGRCKVCGCPPTGRSWASSSCNKGERFPDFMDSKSWEEFKKENNIDINQIMEEHGV